MRDENQLPAAAAATLANLRQNYQVSLEPLTVRDQQLQILQVDDLEGLLGGRDPFTDIESFPFWVKLWEAAVVLADFMASQPPQADGRVLELGAGLGVPGLAAAAAGHRVTLSDFEEHILDFQRVSAAASEVDQRVEHLLLDWLEPPELPQYSMIIGAEILFREEFFQPLLRLLRHNLAPGGVVYLAHDIQRRSLHPFLTLAEEYFTIAMSRRRLSAGDDEEHTVLLSRLTAK